MLTMKRGRSLLREHSGGIFLWFTNTNGNKYKLVAEGRG